jgi:YegS/Rv2252/BmrU family lipid kinase
VPLIVAASIPKAQAAIADLPKGNRVILAGGDGSLQPILAALLAGEHELALLPLGTGNDLARALGVHGLHWRRALELALQAPCSRMDVGQVDLADGSRHYFASSLACGFDAAAGAGVAAMPKFLPGLLRYAAAALMQFAQLRSHPLRWAADGQAEQKTAALLASCLNTPTYASGMRLAPRARIDDGQLQLALAKNLGLLPTLLLFARLLAGGRHTGAAAVHMQSFQQLQIVASETGQALPVLLDGELLPAQAQLHIQVLPQALRVVKAP